MSWSYSAGITVQTLTLFSKTKKRQCVWESLDELEAAEYLTGLGHRNIGYIGPDGVRFQSLSGNVPENGRP